MATTFPCPRCKQSLPATEFTGGENAKAKRPSAWCRPCHRVYARERYARLSPEKKAQYRAMTDAWTKKNRERHRARQRAWRLERHYGLSAGAYDLLLAEQGGLCAICRRPEDKEQFGKTMPLAVDHDHGCCPSEWTCGKCIRGLVCSSCNKGLGAFGDDMNRVAAAAAYLRRAADTCATKAV